MDEQLLTVNDIIADARTLLLDTIGPNRYTDQELLVGLNTALLEIRRVRADLFLGHYKGHVPKFNNNDGETIHIEPQFRLAIVYGTLAHALMRDDEDVQDARANAFESKMIRLLVGSPLQIAALQGGTPGPQNAQK
jgi:hypothetical protein